MKHALRFAASHKNNLEKQGCFCFFRKSQAVGLKWFMHSCFFNCFLLNLFYKKPSKNGRVAQMVRARHCKQQMRIGHECIRGLSECCCFSPKGLMTNCKNKRYKKYGRVAQMVRARH